MDVITNQVPDPQVFVKAQSRSFTARYKQQILAEYELLDKAGKGALLRSGGFVYLVDGQVA